MTNVIEKLTALIKQGFFQANATERYAQIAKDNAAKYCKAYNEYFQYIEEHGKNAAYRSGYSFPSIGAVFSQAASKDRVFVKLMNSMTTVDSSTKERSLKSEEEINSVALAWANQYIEESIEYALKKMSATLKRKFKLTLSDITSVSNLCVTGENPEGSLFVGDRKFSMVSIFAYGPIQRPHYRFKMTELKK